MPIVLPRHVDARRSWSSHLGEAVQVGTAAARDAAPPHAAASLDGPDEAGLNEEMTFLTNQDLLRCPVDATPLTWDPSARRLEGEAGCHSFPIQSGIPCLFAPNQWPTDRTDVTDIVQKFYEQTPFPNYDGLDSRDSLRRKARERVVARLLDEQIPHTASVLEVGCGTGQLTNFLGMGFGRTAIGADLCMNSLKLAKGFRDRFSINNAYFMQINLFRPPFRTASFDVVISNGVLHHTSDCAGAFRSIAPLVKPGGIIIIGLYNWLGRLPTLWRRWLIDKFGETGALLDHRLRGKGDRRDQLCPGTNPPASEEIGAAGHPRWPRGATLATATGRLAAAVRHTGGGADHIADQPHRQCGGVDSARPGESRATVAGGSGIPSQPDEHAGQNRLLSGKSLGVHRR